MIKKVFYCDMDGVIADFYKMENALERFKNEMSFFFRLPTIEENVKGLKEIIEKGEKVKIITTSPNIRADYDKMKWLEKYFPEIDKKDIIFCRPHEKKIDKVPKRLRKKAVLFDDYGKNIKEWVENGGLYSVKITEKIPDIPLKKVYYLENIKSFNRIVL